MAKFHNSLLLNYSYYMVRLQNNPLKVQACSVNSSRKIYAEDFAQSSVVFPNTYKHTLMCKISGGRL